MPTAPHAWVAAAVLAGTAYLALLALGRRGLLKLAPALCCAAALVSVGWIPAAAMLLWAAGDWALLSERRFVAGLLAFLVGHLLFLAALWPIPLASVHPAALATIIAAVVAMLALLLPRVRGVLRAAVPLYAVALGAMALAMSTLGALGTLGGLAFRDLRRGAGARQVPRPRPWRGLRRHDDLLRGARTAHRGDSPARIEFSPAY